MGKGEASMLERRRDEDKRRSGREERSSITSVYFMSLSYAFLATLFK